MLPYFGYLFSSILFMFFATREATRDDSSYLTVIILGAVTGVQWLYQFYQEIV